MNWIEKPWGRTVPLYQDERSEHWLAEVIAGGFSSRHYHRAKDNRIACLTAVVVVTLWGDDVRREILQPGEFIDLPARLVHQFEVVRSGSLWEWYSGDCGTEDIVRLSRNGLAA